MTKEENILVPHWFLKEMENTLRIQNNINVDKKTGETCQDRNIKQLLNGVRKLLNGEELTGMERLEKSQPSLPYEISEVIRQGDYIDKHWLLNLLNEEYEKLSSIEHGVYNAHVSLAKGMLKSLKMKVVSR